MMITIENLLQAHGFGGNGGGGSGSGARLIQSETEPTIDLSDGVFWYNPITDETRIYVDGSFKPLSGGFVMTPFFARTVLSAAQSAVYVNIENFDPYNDILMVSQNGMAIQETTDFDLNRSTRRIVKKFGEWQSGTIFDFTILTLTKTNIKDNLVLIELRDSAIATGTERTVSFNIPQFNPDLDLLQVYLEGVRLFEVQDWNLDPTGSSVTFEYDLIQDERLVFIVQKKLRDIFPEESYDGSLMADGTLTRSKLGSFYDQLESDVEDLKNSSGRSIDLAQDANINNGGELVLYRDPSTGGVEANVARLIVNTVDILNEVGNVREDGATNLQEAKDELNVTIGRVNDEIVEFKSGVQEDLEAIRQSIRIEDGNIVIGKVGSELVARFENDSWFIVKNGLPVIKVEGNFVSMVDAEVSNTMKLGNFAFLPRANGSLDFKRVVD